MLLSLLTRVFIFDISFDISSFFVSGVMQIVMGKQWIVDNAFLIDFYFGLGYGFSSSDNTNYHYGFSIANSSVPISFSSGLKIGFLFK